MEERAINFFLERLDEQLRFFRQAVGQIQVIYRSSDPNLMEQLWYHAQSALIAAANISKIFWPGKEGDQTRGRELRSLLHLPADSSFELRTVRNHWEHFDERLDKWANKPGEKGMADSNVIPRRMLSGLNPDDYFRNYDPETGEISFQDDILNLPTMFRESEEIQKRIQEHYSHGQ